MYESGRPKADYFGGSRGRSPPVNTPLRLLGALEYFVDVEIVSVDMTKAPQCGGYTESVKITVQNNGVASVSDVPLQYSVSGGTAVEEVMTASLAGGASATFTFAVEPDFYGTNAHVVTASVVGDDDVPANSSASLTINTVVSPTGGELTMSSQFDGYFNVGSMGDPDNAVKDYISEYDITRPAAYPAAAPVIFPPQANLSTSEAIPATALFTIASAKSVPKRLFTSNPFL